MTTLLTSIKALLIAKLANIKVVFITPDLLVFPTAPGFPKIGILDNGDEPAGREKGSGFEHLKISLGFYQLIAKPEASVIGDGRNKGVIEIRDAAWAELKLEDFSGAYFYPTYIRGSKTQALNFEGIKDFVAFKQIDIEYSREFTEVT